jgi:molybdopterin-guanine dinucleotide biosynthesis protein
MAIVVVGGHSRNIGKTSVVAGLIAALPEKHWTAFKITQFGHGVCSANGEPCDCETAEHTIAVSEERECNSGTDSSRYLAAGATRSLWVRTRMGQLAEAMPRIRKELSGTDNAIIESNSILRFLKPDLFISVLDAETPDFKESARRYLDRAEAILITGGELSHARWNGISLRLFARARHFHGTPPRYFGDDLVDFVRERLEILQPAVSSPAE